MKNKDLTVWDKLQVASRFLSVLVFLEAAWCFKSGDWGFAAGACCVATACFISSLGSVTKGL